MITRDEVSATGLPLDDPAAIAAQLSIGRTELVKTAIGKGTILGAIGMEAGNALCDVIDSLPDFRHIKTVVSAGNLDMSDPLVRGTVDLLATQGIPHFGPDHAAALKALGERPVKVTAFDVRSVFWD